MWLRLRAPGAASLQNGAWVLLQSNQHAALFETLAADASDNGGTATVLELRALKDETQAAILEQFRGDRGDECAEFGERCGEVLAEITKKTERGKFTRSVAGPGASTGDADLNKEDHGVW
jgi:hypothetical protein